MRGREKRKDTFFGSRNRERRQAQERDFGTLYVCVCMLCVSHNEMLAFYLSPFIIGILNVVLTNLLTNFRSSHTSLLANCEGGLARR